MIIIGEKINGSIPAVGKAIKERDEELIKHRTCIQAETNVDFIDCCASVSEDEEVDTLKWMINLIQEVSDIPISIDSPSAQSCIEAIKYCNKPGLINSVSMEGDKIDLVFKEISKTKWECVALLCEDNGIPQTTAERMKVFHNIMDKAKEYDIAPSRLHIDPLVFTLSTNEDSLTMFAECCQLIKAEYPEIHITSGLSNISFGLPGRKYFNQSFMVLAMNAGMDCAIMDPTNRDMMAMIYATDALLENDDYCLDFIKAFKKGVIG